MATEVQARHLDAAREEAREEALRDADTLADWLGGHCMYGQAVKVRTHLSTDALQRLIDANIPTADLFAIAMEQGQPKETRTLALDTIGDRYLATRAEQIERKACARAGEIAEQEQADAFAAVDETFGYVRAAA